MSSFSALTAGLLLAPLALLAQTTPPAKAPATATAAGAPAAPAPLALAPVTPAPDPNALKIKADLNPITHVLMVRCDAPGPTRVEINDKEGRPVLTKTVMVGTSPVAMKVASLPAGPYLVRCTAGEKKGTRLVQLGD